MTVPVGGPHKLPIHWRLDIAGNSGQSVTAVHTSEDKRTEIFKMPVDTYTRLQTLEALAAIQATKEYPGWDRDSLLGPPVEWRDVRPLKGGGLLFEHYGRNRVHYSSDFSNGWWTKTGIDVNSQVTLAPDRVSYADRLVPTGTGAHRLSRDFGGDTDRTHTIYAKADGSDRVRLEIAGGFHADFDLTAGTITDTVGITWSATIDPAGNGWYRCRVTILAAEASAHLFRVHPLDAAGAVSYTPDGESVFVWGAQSEERRFPLSLIRTAGAEGTRAADPKIIKYDHGLNPDEGTIELRVKIDEAKPSGGTALNDLGVWEDLSGRAQHFFAIQHLLAGDRECTLHMYFVYTTTFESSPKSWRLRMRNASSPDHVIDFIEHGGADPSGLSPYEELLFQIRWGGGAANWLEVWANEILVHSEVAQPAQWPALYGEHSLGPMHIGGRWDLVDRPNGQIREMRLSSVRRTVFPTGPLVADADTLWILPT